MLDSWSHSPDRCKYWPTTWLPEK